MNDALDPPLRPVRLSQEERRTQTRLQLLNAARTLFARQGFAGTSLDQVAQHAGYSRGAFHHHFSSKEDLLIALVQACFETDLGLLKGLLDADPARQAEVFRAGGAATALNREAHLLKLEFWICALRLPRFGEVYARELAAYRRALADLIGAGAPLQRRPAEQQAAILVALASGLDTQKLIDPAAFSEDLYDQALADVMGPEATMP